MVYQRKSGTDGKLKTIAVCLTALLLSLASFDQAWAVVTNQTTNATYNGATQLQDAITAAGDGHTLLLSAGVYSGAISITNDVGSPRDLTLTASLANTVFVQPAVDSWWSDDVFTINAPGSAITLEKLYILLGSYGIKSTNGNVNVSTCTFSLNGFSSTAYSGSPTASSAETHWLANSSTAVNGTVPDGGAIHITDSTGGTIDNCTIFQNDRGITLVDCATGTIRDNTITGNNQSGIYLTSSTTDGTNGCTDTTVQDNTSSTNKENGIKSEYGLGNTIKGNTCASNWNAGIMLSHPGQITVGGADSGDGNTLTSNNAYAFNGKGETGNAGGSVYVTGETGNANATFAFKMFNNTISNGSAGGAGSATGLNLHSAPDTTITVGGPTSSDGDGNTFSGMAVDILVQSRAANTTVINNNLGSTAGIQNTGAGTLTATYNWWGDQTGPGGTGSGEGKTVSAGVTYDPWWELSAMRASVTTFALRAPTVLGPIEAIKVYLDISSDWGSISSVGARLTYESDKVSFTSIAMGSGVPNSWSATYSETGTTGEIDVVIKDANSTDNITSAPSSLEVLAITFTRTVSTPFTDGCNDPIDFDFNTTAGDGSNMATEGRYIKRVNTQSNTVTEQITAVGTPVSGPTVTDYSFIRGNVNNRSAHRLDLADVIDLAAYLYSGLSLGFNCAAATDVNNDGAADVSDVVTLVQAIFNTSGVSIAAPNFSNPGLGRPGVVDTNGGAISSVLGCATGETCN